jgi:hypothetical protein
MEERVFIEKQPKPAEESLLNAFGESYRYFKCLMDISESYNKDWNFSKTSGWMLKVHNNKKALFYVIPLKNEFKISMAIRENELNTLLKDNDLKKIHQRLLDTKKYREGFAIRFKSDDKDYKYLEHLIRKLISIRN